LRAGQRRSRQVVINTCKVLDAADAADIPVAVGAAQPLIERSGRQGGSHGRDGLAAIGPTAIPGTVPAPACRSSDAAVSAALLAAAERSNRVISRTVTPLPHQSAASRSERLSSLVIVRSICPARCSASRTRASRSPSAVSTATARPSSRVAGRHALRAGPPGHLTLSGAPLASPTADSSVNPLSTPVFSLSPKPFRRLERSLPAPQTCFAYLPPDFRSAVRHT